MKRRQHLRSLLDRIGETLWVWPTMAIVAGFGLGVGLVEIEADTSRPLLFTGDAAAGRDVLLAIIAVTFTVTATVFSFVLIVLQLAASQFSPRSLRTFVRDRNTKSSLAVFMGVIAYATAVLMRTGDGRTEAPALAVSLALAFVLVAVVTLAFLINHTAQSVRIEHLMRSIADDTMAILPQLRQDDVPGAGPMPPRVDRRAIPAVVSGYVQGIDVDRLLALAEAQGVVIALRPWVGDHCIAGLPIAEVWPAERSAASEAASDKAPTSPGATGAAPVDALRDGIAEAVDLGVERTMIEDVAFGLRQLVDMAIRAMSPAINDPRTAVEATLHVSRVLCALAPLPLATLDRRGTADGPQVCVRRRGFPDYLGLACDEIRRFGAREPSVVAALMTMLEQVAACQPTAARVEDLRRHLELVLDDARREVSQPADVAALEARAQEVLAQLADHAAAQA